VLQQDFSDASLWPNITRLLPHARADVVLSDMLPNMTGNATIDQSRMLVCAACERSQPHSPHSPHSLACWLASR